MVSITATPATLTEDGAANAVFTVSRGSALPNATTVNIGTFGTATSGTDYTGGVTSVTIPANATSANITINPTADTTVEPDETVTLSIAAGTGYTIGTPSNATTTILNDDVPSASIAVSPASVAEDGAANLVYTVTLNSAPNAPVSINYTVGGTATNGTDYATITSPLVINTGNTTGTITVNPTADATIEADETVVLTLAAGTGYSVGAPNAATGTILNDDVANLTINDVTISEGNSGTTNATFTVSLSAPAPAGGVSFDIATANGTATAGVDYVAQSLTGQTIAAGSSTYTFTVQINGDSLNEASETFFVNVTNVTNATVVDAQGVGTITNDDPLPSLSINDVTVAEGNAGTVNAVFTVTLSAASGQTVTVNYATADGTATQPGDYTAANGTVTFAPGQTVRTLGVPVVGENLPEANETFLVNLSGATNATIADNQGVGTITNDDVPVTVSPGSLTGGTVGVAYSQSVTASGGTGPYTYVTSAGALPAGLTLSSGGVLSGIPTAGGSFTFTITATDSSAFPGPYSGSQAYILTIAAPAIALPATTLSAGTLSAAYSDAISPASGGTSPFTYAVSAGALPGGLTLNASTGAITGTPGALGTFNFSVTATDSSTGTGPFTATQSYAITINDVAPVAGASSLSVAYGAGATNVPLSLSGGPAVSLALATLPAHGTATVSGTTISYQPNAGYSGPDSFTYTATNSGGTSAPATVSVTVADPSIAIVASGSLSTAVGASYSQTFTFSGGATPFGSYQVTGLPAGLAITGNSATSVTVSGTPTQAGSFTLGVSGTDSSTGNGPFTFSDNFTLNVAAPTLTLAPGSTGFTTPYALAYSQSFVASGGTGSFSYAVTGALPPGMSFSGNAITGTGNVPGTYAFSVTATDTGATGAGAPFSVTENYTIEVQPANIVVGPASLPDPLLGSSYSQMITASGGAISLDYAVTAGRLPDGIQLIGETIAGVSFEVGTFNFTITVTDGNGQSGSRAYSITIAPPTYAIAPTSGTLSATYNTPFSQAFTASGGSGTFLYTMGGALPTGLTFSNGTISGTPIAPGSYAITVTATDQTVTGVGAPFSVTGTYTIDVPGPVIAITPAALPNGQVGAAYTQALSASGGAGTHTVAITAGTLPAGLSFANGAITGTPTQAGTFNLTLTGTDANGQTASQAYSLTIAAPNLALTPGAGALTVTYAAPFSQAFTASGGTGSYSYALSGTLPAGMTFSNGTLSGTPTVSGSFPITVTATDTVATGGAAPFSIAQNYTIAIATPTIALAQTALPVATAGAPYSATLSASGAVAPYRYRLQSGTLPTGLTLSQVGVISGTPTAAGSFALVIEVTDANGQIGTAPVTLTVGNATITVTPTQLPGAIRGIAYSQQLTAAGGVAPYSFAVTSGSLPAGLTLSAQGLLSGTATTDTGTSFTVTVTDSTGGTRSTVAVNYTLSVAARPNPANDEEVRGLAQAQVTTARRFADSQVRNFGRRLEGIRRGGGSGGFRNSINLSAPDSCLEAGYGWLEGQCDAFAGELAGFGREQSGKGYLARKQGFDAAAFGFGGGAIGGEQASTDQPRQAATGNGSDSASPFTLWAAGTVRYGDRDGEAGLASQEFETEGLTIGADYRFSPAFTAGLGLGLARDTTDVGENGSESRGDATALAIYGSHLLGGGFFIDWLAGYQWLDFDLQRYVGLTGELIRSSRSGHQWFGAVSAGADIEAGDLRLTPYARIDAQRGQLDGYVEESGSVFDLQFLDQDIAFTAISLGASADYRIKSGDVLFLPRLRFEFQRDIAREGEALVGYFDGGNGGIFNPIAFNGYSRSRLLMGAGTEIQIGALTSLDLEYNNRRNSGAGSDNGIEIGISQKF
ncbi:putative Ig domain-containing protein [Altererythrobacter sp. BO-6]|uniref:putative Ig domain-containing protein n=1 Tax=Altererythrobacter sp. BO-6 TaxID=2604537 RepID=UPI00240788B2|nr:putative Ig domain-containing protein [Altererythrobacter sp. BO-6]